MMMKRDESKERKKAESTDVRPQSTLVEMPIIDKRRGHKKTLLARIPRQNGGNTSIVAKSEASAWGGVVDSDVTTRSSLRTSVTEVVDGSVCTTLFTDLGTGCSGSLGTGDSVEGRGASTSVELGDETCSLSVGEAVSGESAG
jgi:molybdopterin-binding protein